MVIDLTLFRFLHLHLYDMLSLEIFEFFLVFDAKIQLLHFQQLLYLGFPLVNLVVFIILFANDYVLIITVVSRFYS